MSGTVTFTAVDDNLVESVEDRVYFQLGTLPAGYTDGPNDEIFITITDTLVPTTPVVF